MTTETRLSYVVPTVGRSPYLQECLEALVAAGDFEIILTAPSDLDLSEIQLPDHVTRIDVPAESGYTGACNQALSVTKSNYVALVNDDAVVAPDWTERLLKALQQDSNFAAVQGTNLQLGDASLVDGYGIAWNRRWQAVQWGHGSSIAENGGHFEIFGVSCTAAVLRRSALEAVAFAGGEFFDTRLGTYYEDVDIACRLRGHGYRTLCIPEAHARHAGAASSSTNTIWRWGQIYGNRQLVLARLWGKGYLPRLPLFMIHDLQDLIRGGLRLQHDLVLGIVRGWGRAVRHLPRFAHRGDSLVALKDLRKYQTPRPKERASS